MVVARRALELWNGVLAMPPGPVRPVSDRPVIRLAQNLPMIIA
jgi:hypothetical protein